jgi:dTDP-4-amino-4,6-dideoxygalactose transaminase
MTFRIPYVSLAAQHAPLRAEILNAVGDVLDSGAFILGPHVAALEERFAALCGTRHAVGVASGTDALILALRALKIGSGDEVITVPNSFVATASAIALVGARPCSLTLDSTTTSIPQRSKMRSPRARARSSRCISPAVLRT